MAIIQIHDLNNIYHRQQPYVFFIYPFYQVKALYSIINIVGFIHIYAYMIKILFLLIYNINIIYIYFHLLNTIYNQNLYYFTLIII